ncbi:putative ferredoxin/ferredoxin--NADP reductase [Mycobacteroides abscessus subsp. massiliense]|uniref:FAD-dependent oxidoreductase n=1 Tax=Mycobacteroides abscessus TaxID=36809 RepID=UPI0009CFB6AC|nr:FAD-dependent oxidoreductase [Mycobacteroides abscessus]SKF96959.1 putative ferredoxin/ferredoxin--NADP reductase [Mycobacteroides abscessus subsp. massiliense]SKG33109.1 putative ferredoxin/ferredoxin--NADP reductase [Mycobacteroides abscessus subsp. massiliense]SKH71983.1 putative ferredoxin/ferredoxin--NADP reductase [Mycobacteroides abscessus subsp. massiliense]SKI48688.1 putative ferredoxin/ferredoxin--NADP reductase [Mycobacteroides abscessus subsp. massiliense]
MPHVVTQACCNEGSCVYACPVNCIHPTPDEPDFLKAEMLHIDASACVDCGACVAACPVDAIKPDSTLKEEQLPFLRINSEFYPREIPRASLAPVIQAPPVRGTSALKVAIVGSGPAAMYAADELLTQPNVKVNMFERLPAPYGLVRAGVAPDHQQTKRVTKLFDTMAAQPNFEFFLNVEVGKDITHEELLAHHHAVIYSVGASSDRRLDIPGIELPGNATATQVVAWINAHPDYADFRVDLDHERAVVIGNGNVALDVARVLTGDVERLARTDISDTALTALRSSKLREVVIVGRRGPEHSAFTLPELLGLVGLPDMTVVIDQETADLVDQALQTHLEPLTRQKLEVLSTCPREAREPGGKIIRFAYNRTPARVLGEDRVEGIEFQHGDTTDTIKAGLFLTSIGYRGVPMPDVPFDSQRGTIPNEQGRVKDSSTGKAHPGTYVAGWIKRGPTGFIGTNKSCSQQTVTSLVEDYNNGLLADPPQRLSGLSKVIQRRQPTIIGHEGWLAIDRAEIARGQGEGRPRDKFVSVPEMLRVAADAPQPPLWRKAIRGSALEDLLR